MTCRREHFLPIEDYGVIGNTLTVALVSKMDASIDHFCFPHFDSPLLFGQMLSRKGGGYYRIAPNECRGYTPKQLYLPSSNVLVTRFLGAGGGVGQVTDFLPVTTASPSGRNRGLSVADELISRQSAMDGISSGAKRPRLGNTELDPTCKGWPWLIRKAEVIRGRIKFRLECQPAFDYGRRSHRIERQGDCSHFISDCLTMQLQAFKMCPDREPHALHWSVEEERVDYDDDSIGTVEIPRLVCTFELDEAESIFFLLRRPHDEEEPHPCATSLQSLLRQTNDFWHGWLSACTYRGRWREMIHRSALVLKLMTFSPTGAIVAAPTTSLPEELRGGKNWDYRFTWIRDAAFTIYAFLRIGFRQEASDFMHWIEQRCREIQDDDPIGLRLMYDIRGRHPTIATLSSSDSGGMRESSSPSLLTCETELTHWTGYKDSGPVRLGNLAAFQQQLDIYGELLDAVYLCDKWVRPVSYDFWVIIRDRIIPQVMRKWSAPDHGIWEARGEPQHHVYSKLMAWVALDRVIRLARKRSLPAPLQDWLACRDAIHQSVMEKGYDRRLGCFTQYYGGSTLDASNLMMPLVFFLSPDDPRFLNTLGRTLLPPRLGGLTVNHLVFRYYDIQGDGADPEGTFTICSFWLVEALARAGVRHPTLVEEARLMFEDIIGYANHLGLFSEEIGLDGSALGNFPQAFTHLSLISAAFNLDKALG